MHRKLLDMLCCPKCQAELALLTKSDSEHITTGTLTCVDCNREFPIIRGIPRFVEMSNYAASFGLQWTRFAGEQLDSKNGTNLSAERFYAETGWTKEMLKGKWVLDAGCGAGRFADVASLSGAEVVAVDLSSAIDAAAVSLAGRPNLHFVQASLYDLPFRRSAFDACYCIGVIQHTPDPNRTMETIPRVLKAGGQVAVTMYERRRWTKIYPKYLIRPLTKRLEKEKLLRAIELTMPALFPVTEVLFRLPYVGRIFQFGIPIANYANERRLTRAQRYDWALMDTFDMLSPEYDFPQRYEQASDALRRAGVTELKRLLNPGLNLVGQMGATG